ncbi:hypothetical protein ACFFRR_004434 [Megaselia abdita]
MKILLAFVIAVIIPSISSLLQCGEKNSGVFDNSNFYPWYKVCVDITKSETYFTYHTLKPNTGGLSTYKRPNWKTKLYENVGTSYNMKLQFENYEKLGLPYINGTDSIYFVHFHLVPAGDFDTKADRDSTFYVENCVPGFQKINNGNWLYIEDKVKSSAVHKTEVITGQFGQLVLMSTSGQNVSLTLESDRVIQKKVRYDHIKVPEFFYKIVRDTVTKEGYVIITSNNPFMTEFSGPKMCKEDNCAVPEKLKDFSKGYTYCCNFSEFAKNMKKNFKLDFTGIIDVNNTIDAKIVPV